MCVLIYIDVCNYVKEIKTNFPKSFVFQLNDNETKTTIITFVRTGLVHMSCLVTYSIYVYLETLQITVIKHVNSIDQVQIIA